MSLSLFGYPVVLKTDAEDLPLVTEPPCGADGHNVVRIDVAGMKHEIDAAYIRAIGKMRGPQPAKVEQTETVAVIDYEDGEKITITRHEKGMSIAASPGLLGDCPRLEIR